MKLNSTKLFAVTCLLSMGALITTAALADEKATKMPVLYDEEAAAIPVLYDEQVTAVPVHADEHVTAEPVHYDEPVIVNPIYIDEQITAEPVHYDEQPYNVIHEGTYTPIDTVKTVTVLDNHDAYSAKLSALSEDDSNPIDFGTSKVLVIEAGVSSNSGYGVRFNGMIELDDYVVADVSYLTPSNGAACSYMYAITNPYTFVQINTIKPVLVNERIEQRQCETAIPTLYLDL